MPATAADEDPDVADATARGTANALVLAFYGRIPSPARPLHASGRASSLLQGSVVAPRLQAEVDALTVLAEPWAGPPPPVPARPHAL
ncbi:MULTISPECIES: hypothetical protein [Streptomyces]|uniref:hypothetical protein n=1 Tax=Streptomyces TaxID=1883 RepID=UPI0023DD2192|nr:hypothetical protein [Streptomyces sp. FXJ1.172]WEP00552.1 hypothetical protein A6P39_043205 [Streptomyces sp. FXJ1.172]